MKSGSNGFFRAPLFVFVAALLILLGAHEAAAQDKARELKLSTAQGAAYPLGKAGERWAQLINERSGKAFEVRQYPGAILAQRDPTREFMAVKEGAADLAVGSALAWSIQAPVLGVYVLPWMAAESRELAALVADATVSKAVADKIDAVGVVVVTIAPLGDRVLATIKAPVRTPAEMNGLRVRATPLPMVLDTYTALGAKLNAMDFAAASAAFSAGTLDGQDAPASTLAATRIAASGQKFVTRWGAFSDAMIFAVRRPVWNSWNDEQRALVRSAAVEAAADAGALAREDSALAELTQQGVTIVRLTAAQRSAFRSAVDSVWAKWTSAIGADIVRAGESAVAAAPK